MGHNDWMVSLSNHLGGCLLGSGASTGSATDGVRDRQTGQIFPLHTDHGHGKMWCRGVRGRMVWLTPSFEDRVEHGERPLEVV